MESTQSAFWSIEAERLLTQLETSEAGLTASAAAERLARSTQLRPHRPSAWLLLWDQFKSPIILLLFCSAVLSFATDDATTGWIILVILIASGLLGFWQELSAADAVAKLLAVIETKATVVRDGCEQEVPLEQIVAGDIVRLRAGDLIPGDCRLLSSRDLFLNEAALTGESFPTEKSAAVLPVDTPLARRANALYLGTHVVSGFGSAVVAATGAETEFGRISERLEHRQPESGFERGLRHFGQLLIKVVLALVTVVFAVHLAFQRDPIETLQFALSLAVGMTPQLLPAITSVVLAAGAKTMARHRVIVKQLLAIENLGSMTVLCSDKTGTLTEGIVHLQDALDLDGKASERVQQYAYFNAHFQTGFTNPIDEAICRRQTFDTTGIEKLDEIPYDFIRKRLSVRIARNGERLLVTKGALANVLECCTRGETSDGALVDLAALRPAIDRRFADLSDEGLRVLGLAIRADDAPHISKADERDMTFLGMLVFADPPKADAKETLAQLRDLGVALKIITGDNRAVAASISHRVGIESPMIVTGSDIRTLSEEALRQRAREADVFAEVEPNQKEQIILTLQHTGHVVGYLGDGINDASALHAADVGISVASAVDVAREAAGVVLLKQDLGVLVQGVREGRRTFANTLKYVFFAISANFGYMFSMACASLFLPFLPLLPAQILLVNLLADFPAMALATDSVDPEQIHRPRRWDVRFIARFMLSFGFSSSMFDFLTFGTLLFVYGENQELFHTGWFIESVLTGLMIMLVVRTQRPFFLSRPGKLLVFACSMVALVTVLLPFSPFASELEFVRPPAMLLFLTVGITLLYGVGMEVVKRFFYRVLAS
ncbi:MAG TPA: magnesium-translocating P-type ATPase [Planctomycetaceae bacterium]|nr:magnesium-translocating P-type ATPase [Planctomycetaceae bacterium]